MQVAFGLVSYFGSIHIDILCKIITFVSCSLYFTKLLGGGKAFLKIAIGSKLTFFLIGLLTKYCLAVLCVLVVISKMLTCKTKMVSMVNSVPANYQHVRIVF